MQMIAGGLLELYNKSLNGSDDSDAHLLTLFAIGVSLKVKRILELGVKDGATTYPLLLLAAATNSHLTSVDVNSTTFKCPDDLASYWTFEKSCALDFLAAQTEPYDLIYIDDWHAYAHVKQELNEIDRLTRPSGIVIVHDLMYQTVPNYHCDLTLRHGQWAEGGPYRAVAELDPQFWEFSTIPSCNGLTILRKKYSKLYK